MNLKLFVARFCCAFGLGVWIGGIAMAGLSAATLFPIAKQYGVEAVAPQVFGVILQRFQFVAGVCALLALLGWALERPVAAAARRLWVAQGALTTLMLLITLYMGAVMFPRMNTLQREFLPQFQVATSAKPRTLTIPRAQPGDTVRAEFDGLHHLSTSLVQGVMILGLLALGAFAARTAVGGATFVESVEERARLSREKLATA